MVVCSPSDPSEAKAITHLSSHYNGSMYIRLGKAGEKQIFPEKSYELSIGELHCYQECSSPNVVLASGSILAPAVAWLKDNHINAAIYSIPFVKPLNASQLQTIAQQHSNIIVIDEHQKSCGIASAVAEQYCDLHAQGLLNSFPKIHRVEINDEYIHVAGNQQYLRELTGLQLNCDLFE